MMGIRMCMAVVLSLLAMNGAAVGAKHAPLGGSEPTVSDVLAEGQYSDVSEAFVAVVRDAGTYAALRGVLGELPEMTVGFFESNAIVAAFLGTRRTEGYGVMVTSAAGGVVRVSEAAHPRARHRRGCRHLPSRSCPCK